MSCRKYKTWLSSYLDQELPEKDRAVLEAHLKKCQECAGSYNLLLQYRQLVRELERKPAPDGFTGKVLDGIRERKQVRQMIADMARSSFIRVAVIAAMILLIIAVVLPPGLFGPAEMTAEYTLQIKKKGKGPGVGLGERRAESVQLDRILSYTEECGGIVIRDGYNEKSGMTDFLTVRLRKKDYPLFRELFNLDRELDTLPPALSFSLSRHVAIQVFFPGRYLVAGDFNGDGFCDILSYLRQGRLAGQWYISMNSRDGNFNSPEKTGLNDTLTFLPPESDLLSGDIDGDGYDDLILHPRFGDRSGWWLVYLNDGQGMFRAGRLLGFSDQDVMFSGIYLPLTGDMNGDGLDDLVVHYTKGEQAGLFQVLLNRGDMHFSPPVSLPVSHKATGGEFKYLPFLMDFNGDGIDDSGIYWQAGPLAGRWFISLHHRNGQFSPEFEFLYALQGEYTPFTGDFNNDGFDDFCTKSGTPDEIDIWFMQINQEGVKVVFVQNPGFGNNPDIRY